MSNELGHYLSDHIAGSIAALQTIDHLISSATDKPDLSAFLVTLKNEISADQDTLKQIIEGLGQTENAAKKAAAWGAEKVIWLKMELSGTSSLGLLEALESLVLGITGKRGLWQILSVVASSSPALEGIDFAKLIQRAEGQAELVNARRIDVGKLIFSGTK